LLLSAILEISYHEDREQDVPDKKNKMNNKEREIRQESDLSANIKSPTGCRFIAYPFSFAKQT
jgi:RecB family exonuclease